MTSADVLTIPILGTTAGPPLGRGGEFFLPEQGEIFEHENMRYRSPATRLGGLALDDGRLAGLAAIVPFDQVALLQSRRVASGRDHGGGGMTVLFSHPELIKHFRRPERHASPFTVSYRNSVPVEGWMLPPKFSDGVLIKHHFVGRQYARRGNPVRIAAFGWLRFSQHDRDAPWRANASDQVLKAFLRALDWCHRAVLLNVPSLSI
ncbi:hypothetical protein ACQR2B_06730 [Bradyrhizobium oligotrophicum]|uniref:hypothetical protein n=1 Tax=Bradyrhizobium TaxID=374 RepID=UPI003EB84105